VVALYRPNDGPASRIERKPRDCFASTRAIPPACLGCGMEMFMAPTTSRRALLGGFVATPALSFAVPWKNALTLLHDRYDDEPAALVRTKEGRALSRFRYHNAESFVASLDQGFYDR